MHNALYCESLNRGRQNAGNRIQIDWHATWPMRGLGSAAVKFEWRITARPQPAGRGSAAARGGGVTAINTRRSSHTWGEEKISLKVGVLDISQLTSHFSPFRCSWTSREQTLWYLCETYPRNHTNHSCLMCFFLTLWNSLVNLGTITGNDWTLRVTSTLARHITAALPSLVPIKQCLIVIFFISWC